MDSLSTPTVVLEVLQRASSQNPDVIKPAEVKLREWETQPGFYTVLFNVISNHSIDLHVRWIAVLYFKNGIDKYWRKNAPNAISEQEKCALRQGLLANLREPINQIATQLAVLVSKVARIDYPRDWPELFVSLLQNVESSDRLVQHRALLALHHTVKAISSKRLAGDRKMFQEFAVSVYAFALNLWNSYTEAFLRDIGANAPTETITENLEKALLLLRILRKLTVHGFKKPCESADAMCFLKVIFERARSTLECRKQLRGKGIYLLELCEKFIIHLTKILLAVLDAHPLSYVEFIRPSLEFTVFYIFTEEGAHLIYERFVIQCFNLIKGILLCVEYKPAKMVEMTKEPETLRAHQIKTEFFTAATLAEMCRKLVSHYFLLSQDDLAMWDSDPETFATDEGGESWKYSLRPSMETVFVTLFHEFRETLAPVLLEMMGAEAGGPARPDDLGAILRRDAVYNAVGLAAFDLYDDVDFDGWFQNGLAAELRVRHGNYRIIRRRVAWLVGNWTGIKLSPELRPALYAAVLALLRPEEDMAVRLTASTTLRHAVDDFEFNSEQFAPYLEAAFELLFRLLRESHECDSKMHVLNVLSLLIERVGGAVRPHSEALVHYLPQLWHDAHEHNMLRCAIVSTLVQLVKALGGASVALHPFLLPVIQLGTDVRHEAVVYLLEDCLELWLAVLENSSAMTPQLVQLFDAMPSLLDYSTENLRCCLCIVQAHVLLAPERALQTHGPQIATAFDSLVADLRYDAVVLLMRVLETCVRAAPALAAQTLKPILPRIVEAVYLREDYPMLCSVYLSVVSRVLLVSSDVFAESVAHVAHARNLQPSAVLDGVLDAWLSKMPCVTQQDRRKLLALALCNLLTAQSRSVLDRFAALVTNVHEAFCDIARPDGGDSLLVVADQQRPSESPRQQSPPSSTTAAAGNGDELDYDTEHDRRKRQLVYTDPVHNIVLRDYFASQLDQLGLQVGRAQFDQLVATVPAETLEQVKAYLTL